MRLVLDTKIDIRPDSLYLTSTAVEKPVTVYIELPANVSPKDIDISAILLFGDIGALESPVNIICHDQNGVCKLVVKYDRQIVVDYLISTK